MTLEAGLHYLRDGVISRCIRDTGSPVYAVLKDLIGLYTEAVI